MSKADEILTTAIMDMENRGGSKLDFLLIQNELGDLPKSERDKVEKELFDKIEKDGYDYSGYQESKAKGFLSFVNEEDMDPEKARKMTAGANVADSFTRFLIGDADQALKELTRLKGQVKTPKYLANDPEAHNKLWMEMYNLFIKAVEKIGH